MKNHYTFNNYMLDDYNLSTGEHFREYTPDYMLNNYVSNHYMLNYCTR